MLRSSLGTSHSSHEYVTRNSNEKLFQFPGVEAIRLNLNYQFVKVWLEVPKNVKGQLLYLEFKNVLPEIFSDNADIYFY